MSIYTDLCNAIFPTPDAGEPTYTFRWRQSVAIILVILLANMAAARGFLQPVVDGFAYQKTVAGFQKSFNDVLARIVAGNMIAMHSRYCDALQASNNLLAQQLDEVITDLQEEYQGYTGHVYPLRPCP